MNYFKNSFIPDEFFFQTVIMNSKFKNTIINYNFRSILVKKNINNLKVG
jgi:hypothetical protein